MKPVVILSLIVLFSCKSGKNISTSEQTELSNEVAEMVESLIKTDYIGTENLGRSSQVSPAYIDRENLLSTAREKELLALIDHPEGEVAATAFEGLVRKEYPNLTEQLFKLGDENRKLNYIKGDVLIVMSALEYAYVVVLGNDMHENPVKSARVKIGLTSAEKSSVEKKIISIRQSD